MARAATRREPTRQGAGELLVRESTGSKHSIATRQIDTLPTQMCAAEVRVHRRAFAGAQGRGAMLATAMPVVT